MIIHVILWDKEDIIILEEIWEISSTTPTTAEEIKNAIAYNKNNKSNGCGRIVKGIRKSQGLVHRYFSVFY